MGVLSVSSSFISKDRDSLGDEGKTRKDTAKETHGADRRIVERIAAGKIHILAVEKE